jgi:hypothetical protein
MWDMGYAMCDGRGNGAQSHIANHLYRRTQLYYRPTTYVVEQGGTTMTTSDLYFVLTMFFTCMGCYAVLTTGFVFFARRLQRKGS